jgi:mannose-6-phosphate isomerase-like protein (cupin superfamily)
MPNGPPGISDEPAGHAHNRIVEPDRCILLPARVLHQVENTGDVPIREVAVFVPGGSPAAAEGTSVYAGQPDDPDR